MKVAVIGMGFAGLRAAMLLEQAGVEVCLYEARTRPGGRALTVDEGQGVVYEAGGEWLDADHHRALGLIRELGMEPEPRSTWPERVIYKSKVSTAAELWNDALEDELRVEGAARELCRGLTEPPWKNAHVPELDERNLEQFLREHTESERGLWWVTANYRSDEGDDLEQIGLLGWLSGFLHYLDRDGDVVSAFRFPGGSSKVVEGMLSRIKADRRYGKTLSKVRQDQEGVVLYFEGEQATYDRAILTMPPPAVERVVFEPPLSVQKRCAVEACRMSRAIKISWQFETAWWKDKEWGGGMKYDGPLQQTWDGSFGEAPVLNAYVCGKAAMEWISLGDPVRAGAYELSKVHPEAGKTLVRGWFHDWVTDPYSQGAFSHLAPGYVLGHMEHIAPPHDRVHFAGEHTGLYQGFFEGALESAERVVGEILHA
jgi:monoamine oxidase